MSDSDKTIKRLKTVRNAQNDQCKQNACKIVLELVDAGIVDHKARLVQHVCDENWTKVFEFFDLIVKGCDTNAFCDCHSQDFIVFVRDMMRKTPVLVAKPFKKTQEKMEFPPTTQMAGVKPEPSSCWFLCVGVACLAVLAMVAMSIQMPAEQVKPVETSCRASLAKMEANWAETKAELDKVKNRLHLQEMASATAEEVRNKGFNEALSKFSDTWHHAIEGMSKGVQALEARIGEGLVMVEKQEARLKKVNEIVNEYATKANSVQNIVEKHLDKTDLLDEKIKDVHAKAKQVELDVQATAQDLQKFWSLLWYAIAGLAVVGACICCFMQKKVQDFQLLTGSHASLPVRMQAVENSQAALLAQFASFHGLNADNCSGVEPVPPGPGTKTGRSRRGQ